MIMLDKFETTMRLTECFPNGFLNINGEFIAHRYANEYFILKDCETEDDVKFKILAWFSRAAHKTQPYNSEKSNDKFHKFMLEGINKFLGTEFTEDDMAVIYDHFGNGINKKECYEFIKQKYDMSMLKKDGDER